MTTTKYCCESFDYCVSENLIEFMRTDSCWVVPGCCGGGCYVIVNLKFCPFCGAKSPTEAR